MLVEIEFSWCHHIYLLPASSSCLILFNANCKRKGKTASTNFTWLYFYLYILLLFENFVISSFALYSMVLLWICFRMLCSKYSITFENTCLMICLFHCTDTFYIKIRFCGTLWERNSVTRILFIETMSKSRTIKWWFTLDLQMYVLGYINSNV